MGAAISLALLAAPALAGSGTDAAVAAALDPLPEATATGPYARHAVQPARPVPNGPPGPVRPRPSRGPGPVLGPVPGPVPGPCR
ncbi:hypothetical protein DRB89_40260 [Streptomyces sp. ICC4]|nr:hypothetical protein DRB89_40260 [Streptomyces sp. ICC4]